MGGENAQHLDRAIISLSNWYQLIEIETANGGGNTDLQSSPSNDKGGININRQLRQARVSTGQNIITPIPGSGYWVEQTKQKLKLMGKYAKLK